MTMVERVGEGLARQLNRRQTLKRAAVAVFGAVAAWTVEGFRGNSALAQQCGIRDRRRLHLHPAGRALLQRAGPVVLRRSPAPAAAPMTRRIATPAPAGAAPPVSTMVASPVTTSAATATATAQLCACREFISTGGGEEPLPPPGDDGRPPLPPGGPPQPPPGFGDDAARAAAGCPAVLPVLRLTGRA